MRTELYPIDGPWPGHLAIAPRPRGGDWLEDEIRAWRRSGVDVVLSLLSREEEAEQPLLEGGGDPISAFVTELQTAVDGAANNRMPELLSGPLARDALVMCHRECESALSRKIVSVGSWC
jgi:hypothetical protein